jgi:hypothetical protein
VFVAFVAKDRWREIAITLIYTDFGEGKAQG